MSSRSYSRLSCVLQIYSSNQEGFSIAPLGNAEQPSAKFRSGGHEFAFPHSEKLSLQMAVGPGSVAIPHGRGRSCQITIFTSLSSQSTPGLPLRFKEIVRLRVKRIDDMPSRQSSVFLRQCPSEKRIRLARPHRNPSCQLFIETTLNPPSGIQNTPALL